MENHGYQRSLGEPEQHRLIGYHGTVNKTLITDVTIVFMRAVLYFKYLLHVYELVSTEIMFSLVGQSIFLRLTENYT